MKKSKTMLRCIQEAKNFKEELFPVDCMNILKKHYKYKLERMKPITIFYKMIDLYSVLIDVNKEAKQKIVDEINNYIGEF